MYLQFLDNKINYNSMYITIIDLRLLKMYINMCTWHKITKSECANKMLRFKYE